MSNGTWAAPPPPPPPPQQQQQQINSSKNAWVLHETSPDAHSQQQHSMPTPMDTTNAANSNYTSGLAHNTHTPHSGYQNHAPYTEQKPPVATPSVRTENTTASYSTVAPDPALLTQARPAIAENSYSSIQAAMSGVQHSGAPQQPHTYPAKPLVDSTWPQPPSTVPPVPAPRTTAPPSATYQPQFAVAAPKPSLPRPVRNDAKPKTIVHQKPTKGVTYAEAEDDEMPVPPQRRKEVKGILKKSPSPAAGRGRVGLRGVGYSKGIGRPGGVGDAPVSASVRDSLEITREHMGDRQVGHVVLIIPCAKTVMHATFS